MNQNTQILMVLVSTNMEVTKSNQERNLWVPGGENIQSTLGPRLGALWLRLRPLWLWGQDWDSKTRIGAFGANIGESGAKIGGSGVKIEGWGA